VPVGNVIKRVWGCMWDPLQEKDKLDLLQQRTEEAVDGEYQNYKSHDGAYTCRAFFGKYHETLKMVEGLTDKDIYRLNWTDTTLTRAFPPTPLQLTTGAVNGNSCKTRQGLRP